MNKKAISVILVSVACLLLNYYFIVSIDTIIHKDLYNYGLQFNESWANKYWSYKDMIFLTTTIPSILLIALAYYMSSDKRTTPKTKIYCGICEKYVVPIEKNDQLICPRCKAIL